MTMDEFRESVSVLADELTKKERLRDLTNTTSLLTNDATAATPLPSQGVKATLLLAKIKSLGQGEGASARNE